MTEDKISCGVPGLDTILHGGMPRNRLYLIEGNPGTGKTTIALQFLLEGVRLGEKVLYVTLSETKTEILQIAASHGWSLDNVEMFELSALEQKFQDEEQYSIFPASEVELGETSDKIFAQIQRLQPTRIAFDSLSEMRLLAGDALRYRRQILALKHFFSKHNATVLLLDDRTAESNDLQLQSICHGVIELEENPTGHSGTRCRMRVIKIRGSSFEKGYHDYLLVRGGVVIFPRLVAAQTRQSPAKGNGFATTTPLSSGVPALDSLLGGGLSMGSSALVMGPAGSGKSSIATQFLWNAAKQGKKGVYFLFEESLHIYLERAAGLGQNLEGFIESGLLHVDQVDPTNLSPGEFASAIKNRVERDKVELVVIDSLNGYLNVMPSEKHLLLYMHELLMYLNQKNVLSILIMAQHGMMGSAMVQPIDVSYMADTVLMLRYFEAAGSVRKAISVLKKRVGPHESSIRETQITSKGIKIGDPLSQFQGVLSGIPKFIGSASELMGRHDKQ